MSQSRSHHQVTTNSYHTRDEIKKASPQLRPRDDLKQAFAGKQNKGPAKNQQKLNQGTNVKSRQTEQSKTKTPKR